MGIACRKVSSALFALEGQRDAEAEQAGSPWRRTRRTHANANSDICALPRMLPMNTPNSSKNITGNSRVGMANAGVRIILTSSKRMSPR